MNKTRSRAAERDRLGRMVRDLWIGWAERQPNPKASWLVPYDELSESDKEADRVIGEGMMHEFFAETTGERMEHERLKKIAFRLRQELHGFRELFDETDQASGKAIQEYDEFVGGVYLENAAMEVVDSCDEEDIECTRCCGSGKVPTEGHESYLGAQEKPCPQCHGMS